MKMGYNVTLLVFVVTIMSAAHCCILDNTLPVLSTYDLLDMADVVVYGLDTGHVERPFGTGPGSITNVTDCLFKVYCVLKGNVTMTDIIIEHISPLSSCSGSGDKLNVGMEMIVALKMTKTGNFKYYEGSAMQSSVYESSADNFRTMNNITETSEWQTPFDADTDTCELAIEKVVNTTELATEKVVTTTESIPELTESSTFTSSTQKPEAKVGANLENQNNSAGTVERLAYLLFLSLTVSQLC